MASTLGVDYIGSATGTTVNITGGVLNRGTFSTAIIENANVVATAVPTTVNLDVLDKGVVFYTANTTSNVTINVRGSSAANLDAVLAVGQSATIILMLTQGATAYVANSYRIDNILVTPKWQANTVAVGNANAIDVYSFTVIKTSVTPTYVVLASQEQFK